MTISNIVKKQGMHPYLRLHFFVHHVSFALHIHDTFGDRC